jgi:hypothetical protein
MTRSATIFLSCSLGLLASVACGGDDGGGGGGGGASFDQAVEEFASAICACDPDPAACERDVRTDMADAKAALGEGERAPCIACMDAKAAEAVKMAAADCDESVIDPEAIFAACDLDPAVDYDGDQVPDNDHDQACAGYP